MGFTQEYLVELPDAPELELTRLTIRAPFAGTVIDKHITLGEGVSDDASVFAIADLSTVWLDLHVHERHLGDLCCGQPVTVRVAPTNSPMRGSIEYIHPMVDEQTRTVMARVSLPNPKGDLRPGTFVTATVSTDAREATVAIDRRAVQYLGDAPVVFVYNGASFAARHVTLGRSDDQRVEIVEGLHAGERHATEGSFRLKAEIEKRAAGDVGHGHAH
jgi:cobalt-zinc-cadmium efflux system membrane fusion protein